MSPALALILALQVAPSASEMTEGDAYSLYGGELERGMELCEALGRMSVEVQRVDREARSTASLLSRTREELSNAQGATGSDQRLLGRLEGLVALNVRAQLAQADDLRAAVEDLAVASREWCGA